MAAEMGCGGLGWNGVVEFEWGQGGDWSPADGRAIKMAPLMKLKVKWEAVTLYLPLTIGLILCSQSSLK
ncbi:MAG: hypothetical protein ACK5F6_02390 [Bacteroidota bacterium]